MIIIWLKFLVCTAVILFFGSQLSRYADIIAEKTGLSRAWIGIVLLASVTSMPELANGISAVTGVGMPDLAVADIFGACLYNMVTFSLLIMAWGVLRKGSINSNVSTAHVISGAFTVAMIALSVGSIILYRMTVLPSFFGVGMFSILIAVVYFIAQRVIFLYEKGIGDVAVVAEREVRGTSLGAALAKFAFFSVFVVAAGAWLPFIGAEITGLMGWGGSFVGSMLLGLATTLPELAVSVSAAFMFGSADLAVGNLFGSNVFNVFMIFVFDLFFGRPLFSAVSVSNVYLGLVAIAAIVVGMLSLMLKPRRRLFGALGWDSAGIILLYIFGVFLLFSLGAGA